MRASRSERGRTGRAVPALAAALVGVVLCACSSRSGPRAGAPLSSPPRGPTVVAHQSLPPLVARVRVSTDPSPAHETAMQRLSNAIDAALAQPGRPTAAARVEQKAAAGNQVRVEWALGHELPGPAERLRVRTDALQILRLVQRSELRYGSVLLLAIGAHVVRGNRTVSVVVRAKYTKTLVHKTDWAHVSPDRILRMPDDKPAVIAREYR